MTPSQAIVLDVESNENTLQIIPMCNDHYNPDHEASDEAEMAADELREMEWAQTPEQIEDLHLRMIRRREGLTEFEQARVESLEPDSNSIERLFEHFERPLGEPGHAWRDSRYLAEWHARDHDMK